MTTELAGPAEADVSPAPALPAPAPDAPRPVPDADSAPFWAGLRQERLLLQRCTDCHRLRFPPMYPCPYCRGRGAHLEQVSGRGTVYSWIVVHRAFHPAFAADVPYTVATVDLLEGPRVAVRAETCPDLTFGSAVRATYVHHPAWTELRMTCDA